MGARGGKGEHSRQLLSQDWTLNQPISRFTHREHCAGHTLIWEMNRKSGSWWCGEKEKRRRNERVREYCFNYSRTAFYRFAAYLISLAYITKNGKLFFTFESLSFAIVSRTPRRIWQGVNSQLLIWQGICIFMRFGDSKQNNLCFRPCLCMFLYVYMYRHLISCKLTVMEYQNLKSNSSIS